MMNVNLPYTECWVKKTFLQGPSNFRTGKDETVFAILMSMKAIRDHAPLFEVFLPEYGACYDKVLQAGIFKNEETPNEDVTMFDVAYWDCLSSNAELHVKPIQLNVSMESQTGKKYSGDYLWTIDWREDETRLGTSQVWNEHKQKNFFFDKRTGALCCGPNNKMRWFDKSLSPNELKRPFFRVFEKEHTHEKIDSKLGDSTMWDYSKEKEN